MPATSDSRTQFDVQDVANALLRAAVQAAEEGDGAAAYNFVQAWNALLNRL